MPPYLVIHYSEIGLKGKNRAFFERHLQHNIGERLAGLEVTNVERLSGRLLVTLGPGADSTTAAERLRTVPGIAYVAPAYSTPKDMGALVAGVLRALAGRSLAVSLVWSRNQPRRQTLSTYLAADQRRNRPSRPGRYRLAGRFDPSGAGHPR